MKIHFFLGATAGVLIAMAAGCATPKKPVQNAAEAAATNEIETIGSIEALSPEFFELIPTNAVIEKLAEGFEWAEGPVWIPSANHLLFSDVPKNVVYRWKAGEGINVFLEDSGYTGSYPRTGEPGSNGLTLDSQGRLVLAQHGDRQVARLEKNGERTTLVEYYNWRRFNSPNDLVYDSSGNLYFTDPPYGLPKGNDDPTRELWFHGVYRLSKDGTLQLLTSELRFPNGIALSPDEKTLYVALSDPANPVLMAYDLLSDGSLSYGRVFFDASHLRPGKPGLPDGLKVDKNGNVFTTGPGGVLVLTPNGTHLGTLNTGVPTANCAWGNDGSVLYITADMFLCRVQTKTLGKGF